MVAKILCVAEKPSIAKAVANHLGNNVRVRNAEGLPWLKNYEFDFNFSPPWGQCQVVMTSVAGHLTSTDFGPSHRGWNSCNPVELFRAPIQKFVDKDRKPIAKNIEKQARNAQALFVWTDCDREGEHIGTEIRDLALKTNSRLEVKRARFSNIERAHVINAAKNPIVLDEKQAHAVSARIELDLRIGASFTRLQTLNLKSMIEHLQDLSAISYGSCQFPTLGFVVDRYFKVKNFIPETFWKIQVFHERDGINVTFNWRRVHLFDRMAVTLLFEKCIELGKVKVTKLQTKPTSKWKPLPLTTVELQKVGSRFLRLDSQRIMKIAEDLYTRGFISYPRTETDQFDAEMDLRVIIEKQTSDTQWGAYAQGLLGGNFRTPRSGRNNDKAHPPIHPVNCATGLNDEERRVYEFVVRRFLACCSEDAKGETTTVELSWATEIFSATGLIVLQRNFLDVYPYEKWESSSSLPQFILNEEFVPKEARMTDGKTSPPSYLTEPELIALMDANGIGTDATMAEHIAKIKERSYVSTRPSGGGGRAASVQEFIPTTLGVALIVGYDAVPGLDMSLSKPFLRKEMEEQMRAICAGSTTREQVVAASLDKYRDAFTKTAQAMSILKLSFRKFILNEPGVDFPPPSLLPIPTVAAPAAPAPSRVNGRGTSGAGTLDGSGSVSGDGGGGNDINDDTITAKSHEPIVITE